MAKGRTEEDSEDGTRDEYEYQVDNPTEVSSSCTYHLKYIGAMMENRMRRT